MRRSTVVGVCLAAGLLVGPGSAQEAADDGAAPTAPAAHPDARTTGSIAGRVQFPAVQPRRRRSRVRYPGQAPGAGAGHTEVALPGVVYVADVTAEPVSGAAAVMHQEGIAFDPPVLPVQLGTAVSFPNLDPVYHNVLSYSTAKRFDLGRYAKGEQRTVTFDQPGVVRLACEIHSQMRGFIVVLAQPHFALTDREGRFRIDGVPPGTHRLALWHDRFALEPVTVEVAAGATATATLVAAAAR